MKKKWIAILLAIWLVMGFADFARVHDFEKPIFCVLVGGADDGGSGTYVGLGYSFEIQGNFMPEDEYPGVTKYTYRIFGLDVQTSIRD